MMPGVGHCDFGGLSGADVIEGRDDLRVLEQWREQGKAPASLTAYRLKTYDHGGGYWPQSTPPDPANVAFSRPLYPYPLVARYKGAGDINAASSFKPVTPKAR